MGLEGLGFRIVGFRALGLGVRMVGLGLQGSRVSGSLRDHSEERFRILRFWVLGCRGWRFVLGSNDCIFKAYVSDCCGERGVLLSRAWRRGGFTASGLESEGATMV